jgi:hypothetical protein
MTESRKTLAGCNITRDFFMSTDGQDFDLMAKLMNKGFKELYYSAPYHWAVLHPTEKKIIAYTEGDVDHIDCENIPMLIREAETHIDFEKRQYPENRVIWAEGELLAAELRKKNNLPPRPEPSGLWD